MQAFTKVMKALSDPNRIKILKVLQHRMACVCELQAALDIAQPTVSKHLKILEDAGLVEHRKEGLWVNYYLSAGEKSAYAATMLGNLRHWLCDTEEISALLVHLPGIDRECICNKK